ncbi:MAG: hypothetical protein HFJ10_00850 [Lachnospiraceae bacterium]|nr:hypothetical protein [Lachnospiraceae bacterium]
MEQRMWNYSEHYLKPTMLDMVEENGKAWMALFNRNGICEVDIATRRARVLKVFSDYPRDKESLYFRVEKVNHYLVFSPCEAEKIAIYDLKSDVLTYIPLKPLDGSYKEDQKEVKFWNTFRYQSDVFLLGYSYPAIIKIDMDSMEIVYITDWVEEVEKNIEFGDIRGYFSDGHVLHGDQILFPIGCMNAVLELNLKTLKTKIRRLNISMKGIGGISSADGKNVWFVGRGEKENWIAHWNMETNMIKEFYLKEEKKDLFDPFYAPVCTTSSVFLMPISASNIYEIDVNTGEIVNNKTLEKLFKEEGHSLTSCWKTKAPRLRDNSLLFLTCDDWGWHEYNLETDEVQSYFIYLEEEETEKYFQDCFLCEKSNHIFMETKIPLKCLLEEMKNKDIQDIHKRNINFRDGKEIYDRMCR